MINLPFVPHQNKSATILTFPAEPLYGNDPFVLQRTGLFLGTQGIGCFVVNVTGWHPKPFPIRRKTTFGGNRLLQTAETVLHWPNLFQRS